MFSLFPNHDAPLSGWLAQHSGVLLLFGATIAVCTFLAWHFRGADSGTVGDLDFGSSSDCGDGGGD
jgi:hypothetical protein